MCGMWILGYMWNADIGGMCGMWTLRYVLKTEIAVCVECEHWGMRGLQVLGSMDCVAWKEVTPAM